MSDYKCKLALLKNELVDKLLEDVKDIDSIFLPASITNKELIIFYNAIIRSVLLSIYKLEEDDK